MRIGSDCLFRAALLLTWMLAWLAGNTAYAAAPVPVALGEPSVHFDVDATLPVPTLRDLRSGSERPAPSGRLRFTDVSLALDLEGNAGQVYRLYRAAFGRTPDIAGLSFWIAAMDAGVPIADIAAGFVSSREFVSLYGAHPEHRALVAGLYRNVLGREGEEAGIDFWAGVLDRRAADVAAVLHGFSESPENKQGVLVSVRRGIAYLENNTTYSRVQQPFLAASVPAAAAAAIEQFATPVGSAPRNQLLPAPGNYGAESLVLALNASGRPLLLGLSDAARPALSAESMAVTLTRVAAELVVAPPGVTRERIETAVRAAPSFASLVAAIDAALTRGEAPLESATVIETATSTARETLETLRPATTLQAQRAAGAAAAAPAEEVVFWQDGATNRLWLEDVTATPDLVFKNRSFLVWQVSTDTGIRFHAPAMETTFGQLLAYYGGAESSTDIKGKSPNQIMVVTVDQSAATLRENAIALGVRSLFGALMLVTGGLNLELSHVKKCAMQLAETMVNTPEFAAWVAQPSKQTRDKYLDALFKTLPFKLALGCLAPTSGRELVEATLELIMANVFMPFQAARTGAAMADHSAQLIELKKTPVTKTICKRAGTVAPCGDLTLLQTAWELDVGDSLQLQLALKQADGSFIILGPADVPNNLAWSSNAPGVASVDASGKVLGLTDGPAIVSVSTADGVELGKVQIFVRTPFLYRGTVRGTVQLTGELTVIDPVKGVIVTPISSSATYEFVLDKYAHLDGTITLAYAGGATPAIGSVVCLGIPRQFCSDAGARVNPAAGADVWASGGLCQMSFTLRGNRTNVQARSTFVPDSRIAAFDCFSASDNSRWRLQSYSFVPEWRP